MLLQRKTEDSQSRSKQSNAADKPAATPCKKKAPAEEAKAKVKAIVNLGERADADADADADAEGKEKEKEKEKETGSHVEVALPSTGLANNINSAGRILPTFEPLPVLVGLVGLGVLLSAS